MDASLGEHGIVLDLRLAKRGGVGRDDDELGCGVARARVFQIIRMRAVFGWFDFKQYTKADDAARGETYSIGEEGRE